MPLTVAYMPHRTLQKDGSVVEGFAPRDVCDALHGPTGNKEPLIVGTLTAPKGRGWRVGADEAADNQFVAFHQTQDPISERDATPALGRTSAGMGVSDGPVVRRLTPAECERLMSWPDNWTAPPGVKATDSRRYAACGDGVVANVAEWIGRGILSEHLARPPLPLEAR